MKHYVVLLDWSYDCDGGSSVLEVAHSEKEAVERLIERSVVEISTSWIGDKMSVSEDDLEKIKRCEKVAIEQNDYMLTFDGMSLEAYENGHYNDRHTLISIEEV